MKHLKSINEFKEAEQDFADWLSYKFGKKIGKLIGTGVRGQVYEFGSSNVIKLSISDEHEASLIIDKKIPGVAKVYSRGKIIVPQRFRITFDGKKFIHYIIMEKLTTSKELKDDIHEIEHAISSFIKNKAHEVIKGYDPIYYSPLLELFNQIRNDEYVQACFNYVVNDFNVSGELFAEIVSIFKKVIDFFNWQDIHSGQFGRNSKGELVAFDLDNPHKKWIDRSVKHTIKENKA